MGFKDIRAKIKEKILTLDGIGQVLTHSTSDYDAFPTVIIMPTGYSNEFNSTRGLDESYTFTISVIHILQYAKQQLPAGEDAIDEAYVENVMEDTVDDILEMFRDPKVLEPLARNTRLMPSDWSFLVSESGLFRLAEIDVNVEVRSNFR